MTLLAEFMARHAARQTDRETDGRTDRQIIITDMSLTLTIPRTNAYRDFILPYVSK